MNCEACLASGTSSASGLTWPPLDSLAPPGRGSWGDEHRQMP